MQKMSKEARAVRAAYLREWRKKHPEKQSEYTARKWERKAQQIKERAALESMTNAEAA